MFCFTDYMSTLLLLPICTAPCLQEQESAEVQLWSNTSLRLLLCDAAPRVKCCSPVVCRSSLSGWRVKTWRDGWWHAPCGVKMDTWKTGALQIRNFRTAIRTAMFLLLLLLKENLFIFAFLCFIWKKDPNRRYMLERKTYNVKTL